MKPLTYILLALTLAVSAGCGYTTSSLLPPELDSIHVENFENKIDPAQVVSDKRASYGYWPGLEVDITRAVIDGFIFDRHLEVKSAKTAAMTMKGDLIDFRQYPLSYDKGGSVDEYRVEVTVDIELYDNLTGKLLWREGSFNGQSSYTISGPNATTEAEGVKNAVKDLAQRIVERTVESW